MERETTKINKEKFLQYLVVTRGNVKLAGISACLSDSQFYKWCKDDPAYKAKYIEILYKIGIYCTNVHIEKLHKKNPKAVEKHLRIIKQKLNNLI